MGNVEISALGFRNPEGCQMAGGRSEAETPGVRRRKGIHPGGVTEPPHRRTIQDLEEILHIVFGATDGVSVLARRYERIFWHPSGVLIILSRVPGVRAPSADPRPPSGNPPGC